MTHRFLRVVGGPSSSEEPYRSALRSEDYVKLVLASAGRNVSVQFRMNGRQVSVPMRPVARDLLDFAGCIYVLDELVARTPDARGWRRRLSLLFPVKAPARWVSIEDQLQHALEFLSGDRWHLAWTKRRGVLGLDRHRHRLEGDYDTVCLFSGGVDSLVGAATLLAEGRRVLLVGHQADGATAKAQKRMLAGLQKQFGAAITLVDCYLALAKSEGSRWRLLKEDNTHRARSFLFLGIAGTVAMATEAREIIIPENGIIALNSPLALSRLGTASTRTAHPRFLQEFSAILNHVSGKRFAISNPLMLKNKTDVLRDAPIWLRTLALESVSCSHSDRIRWTATRGVRHCGYCIPCIYRRVAFISIGLDDRRHYLRDVLQDLADLTPTETVDLRLLYLWARRVLDANTASRQGMVFGQGVFDVEWCRTTRRQAPLADLAAMLKRWAEEFVEVLGERASSSTRKILGI